MQNICVDMERLSEMTYIYIHMHIYNILIIQLYSAFSNSIKHYFVLLNLIQPYVNTEFNDFFLAMLTSEHSDIPEDKNISFDAAGNPVSVNNAFFTTCAPMTCQEPGTVYDAYNAYGDEDGDGCPGTLTCNEEQRQLQATASHTFSWISIYFHGFSLIVMLSIDFR